MNKIGFIGTGVMGSSMVINLLKNNYEVNVFNRSYQKAKALEAFGAHCTSTIQECIQDCDVVIMIVGMPNDVHQVAYEVLHSAKQGTILIDMTTSSPILAEKIYQEAKNYKIETLDAPVSGGDTGAKNGTLSIMVGGEEEVYNQCLPIFKSMGTNIIYCGSCGKGQHTKMANQIAIAGTLSGVAEAVIYAEKMGLDTSIMFNAISAGAAGSWQLTNNGIKMINRDYAPGFFIKHFVKDMNIALECSKDKDLDLPILLAVKDMFQEMIDHHEGDLGTQALYKYYKEK